MIRIEIDEKCTGCGICAKKCPTDVFEVRDDKVHVANISNCMACRYCEVVCPQKGIKVFEEC